MWHIQLSSFRVGVIAISVLPARSEGDNYRVMDLLRSVYPEINAGLLECSGPQTCQWCPE